MCLFVSNVRMSNGTVCDNAIIDFEEKLTAIFSTLLPLNLVLHGFVKAEIVSI